MQYIVGFLNSWNCQAGLGMSGMKFDRIPQSANTQSQHAWVFWTLNNLALTWYPNPPSQKHHVIKFLPIRPFFSHILLPQSLLMLQYMRRWILPLMIADSHRPIYIHKHTPSPQSVVGPMQFIFTGGEYYRNQIPYVDIYNIHISIIPIGKWQHQTQLKLFISRQLHQEVEMIVYVRF